jgi:segregation and condensation protein B
MSALAERRIIPHEELISRAERKAEARTENGAHPMPAPADDVASDEDAAAEVPAATTGDIPAQAEAEADATGDEPAATTDAEARPEHYRLLEALLFAAAEPLDEKTLGARLPDGVNVRESLLGLQDEYALRGVNLVRIGAKWTFRTASDLSWLLTKEAVVPKKLSRAAIETLAVIAYHQPVTRVEVEEIRGVAVSKGTFDVLMETGWIRPRGRRKTPGRPITYGTNEEFLSHFGLEAVTDLPGLEELKGAGMLDGRLPPGFAVPMPSDDPVLRDDEDPLEPGDLDLGLAPPPERVED